MTTMSNARAPRVARRALGWAFGFALSVCPAVSQQMPAGVDVLVGRFDLAGTGANTRETILNTANVRAIFGKLFGYELEGAIYAQPLIVSNLVIDGRPRNVVYVATTSDMLYALDADDPQRTGGLLWQHRLTQGGELAPESVDARVQGSEGILSTPVIDRGRNTIYAVARDRNGAKVIHRLYALDLATGREKGVTDIVAYVDVTRKSSTTRFVFTPDRCRQFCRNRAGLTIAQSKVIVTWTMGEGNGEDQHGWIMSYDADTLSLDGVFCTTCGFIKPDGGVRLGGGGIWQSGRPPAVDSSGFVYVFVSNGFMQGPPSDPKIPFPDSCPAGNPLNSLNWPPEPAMYPPKPIGYYAESLLKLDPGKGLALRASWTPYEWCYLDYVDLDMGGSGPMVIEEGGGFSVVGGGKSGNLYAFAVSDISSPDTVGHLLDPPCVVGITGDPRASLQCLHVTTFPETTACRVRYDPILDQGNTNIVNPADAAMHHIMAGPVYWPPGGDHTSGTLFVSAENDCVREVGFGGGLFVEANATMFTKPVTKPIRGHPGAALSLSSDGRKAGTGILWMTYAEPNGASQQGDSTYNTRRGVLGAYAAWPEDGNQLWNSKISASRDDLGYFVKFNPPTIANGKVYVASHPPPDPYRKIMLDNGIVASYTSANSVGYLLVYGLNPPPTPVIRTFAADLIPSWHALLQ